MTESQATPTTRDIAGTIDRIDLPSGLSPRALADLLAAMPEEIADLPRRGVESGGDSATVIYITGEETSQPQFGMVVALIVPPQDDAAAAVVDLQRTRWGDPDDHTITASSSGDSTHLAFREFWRTFPPGLFALPNQPVYFLLFYRAESEYAFMLIASTLTIRKELVEALGASLGP